MILIISNDFIIFFCVVFCNLVCEWGFLCLKIVGLDLLVVVVYVFIEFGNGCLFSVDELVVELRVSIGQVRGVVFEFVGRGLVRLEGDGGSYGFIEEGKEILGRINGFVQRQVVKVLEDVGGGNGVMVGDIMFVFRIWMQVLERVREVGENFFMLVVMLGQEEGLFGLFGMGVVVGVGVELVVVKRMVEIVFGYQFGILGRVVEMYMEYYYLKYNWGREFEMVFMEGMFDLLKRVGNGKGNQVWVVVFKQFGGKDRIVGIVFIDGEIMVKEGVVKLRVFIVDEEVWGLGVGKRFL